MRGWYLLVALLLVPATTGQALPERLLGEDRADDVELFLQDGTSLGYTDQYPHLDLLGAEVFKADDENMAFQIRLNDPSYANRGDEASDLETSIALHFHFGTIHYYVDYGDWQRDGGEACLTRYIDGERIDPIQCFSTESNGQDLQVKVPSAYITDEAGAKLRHPAQLTKVWAEGRMDTYIDDNMNVRAIDKAPDDGTWGDLLTPANLDAGPLVLTPIQPVRGSNGGPDLIVYHVLVDNIGDEAVRATPSIDGLPDQWEATVPGQIRVEPFTTYDLPILVRIPGAHAHGTEHEFDLTLETDEKSWTETLGLNFFKVPQPAGHHSRMYLHGFTGDGFTNSWISTVKNDELADGTPEDGWGTSSDATTNTADTLYYVNSIPDLLIGLDFEIKREALTELTFTSDVAVSVELRVALEHCNPTDNTHRSYAEYRGDMRCPGSWIPLAETSQSLDLIPGPNELELPLSVKEYADLVPPQNGALLGLMIELRQPLSTFFASNVVLETDGTLDLPLREYRDPLDDALASLADLSLQGESEIVLGPGSTAWREWTIRNDGPARAIELSVFGHNAEWITLSAEEVNVPAKGTATFHVGIETRQGFADVFILAVDKGAASKSWAHPLRVESDPGAPTVREGAPISPDKESPAPLGIVVLALALLGLIQRSRRHG